MLTHTQEGLKSYCSEDWKHCRYKEMKNVEMYIEAVQATDQVHDDWQSVDILGD